ncbi:malectin domain-containing carbohydrate-binding protein, partial [Algoriphagus chordae]
MGFLKNSLLAATAFCFLLFLSANTLLGQTVSFNQTSLNFNGIGSINQGTAVKFGPDGRLYVTELNGAIKIFTIEQSTPGQYSVLAMEYVTGAATLPNHDDNGDPAWDNRSNRQLLGITVVGTAQNPVIFAPTSDPKWGGPSGDEALDTNSGVITMLSWNGSQWEIMDLVRGLPRSEENHSVTGVEYTVINNKEYLLVNVGGNNNAGAPSTNFAMLTEYAYSGSIIQIDLEALLAMETKIDPITGRPFKYDIPTLDDPSRANVDNIYDPNDLNYTGIDVGDPWGGNDGLNQAMLIPDGPIQIFASGLRHSYDLVVMGNGSVYATNNGANTEWGGLPENEGNPLTVTNNYLQGEPGTSQSNPSASGEYVNNNDHLLLITNDLTTYNPGDFYAGHTNPIRANPGTPYVLNQTFPFAPGGAGLYTNFIEDNDNWQNLTPVFTPTAVFRTEILEPVAPGASGFDNYATNSLPVNWPPVPLSMKAEDEADYRSPGLPNPNGPTVPIVTSLPVNSNAIDEYRSHAFGGALHGALVIGQNGGGLHVLTLNPDGSLNTLETNKFNLNGGNPLGITTRPDDVAFPGTIWVSTFDNRIMILTPEDDFVCIDQESPEFEPNADYDGDGYTNQDEIDNGTEYCSGASRPNDFDQDLISDLNDDDDDGDGIIDSLDPFQIGSPSSIPLDNELFSNQQDSQGRQFGYLGLGLTGFMNNGAPSPNWLNWLDVLGAGPLPNDIYGGAAGAIQLAITGGTANGIVNNQEKGFQFGILSDTQTGDYTITTAILGLNTSNQFYSTTEPNSEIGIQIGDGTQSNFLKLVFTQTGILAAQELNDIPDANPVFYEILPENRPSGSTAATFKLTVSPENGTVIPSIIIGTDTPIVLEAIQLDGSILSAVQNPNEPLAIGVLGTSGNTGVEFSATYSFFNVTGEKPYSIRTLPDISKTANSPNTSINLLEYFNDNGGNQNLVFSIAENTNSLLNATITGNTLEIEYPSEVLSSSLTIRATDLDGLFDELQFSVNVLEPKVVLLRINVGGNLIEDESEIDVDWLANNTNGSFQSTNFSVNAGTNSAYAGNGISTRDASIPAYIDNSTFSTLFQTERYNSSAGDMIYSIPLPNGEYDINLYFGNSYSGTSGPGQRLFDIIVEDEVVYPGMDLSLLYGHLAGGMESFTATVDDGELNIALANSVENALLNGLEIIGQPITLPLTLEQPVPDQENRVGETLGGNLVMIGQGGKGALTYSAENLPPGISIEPTNGVIGGTIEENANSNSPYLITLHITDSQTPTPNTVSQNLTWVVKPRLENENWVLKGEDISYTPRHEMSFVKAGERFFLMGGREQPTDVDIYDVGNDSWQTIANSAPFEFNHFQAVEYKGLIWVIGAFQDNNFDTEAPATHIWIFNPVTYEWIEGPEIPETRRRGAAGLVLYQDNFYLVGGSTEGHNGGFVPYFDEYNPTTGEWNTLDDAPIARDHAHAVVLGNKLYFASGRQSGGETTFAPLVDEVDVWDFNTSTWSTLDPALNIPTPRAGAFVGVLDGQIVYGGGEPELVGNSLSSTIIFDPTQETWTAGAELNFGRHGTQAIVTQEGIIVTGGSPVQGGGNMRNMEYLGDFNPDLTPILESTLEGPEHISIISSSPVTAPIVVSSGTQGIFIDSIYFQGGDFEDFEFVQPVRKKFLLADNSSSEIEIAYIGSGNSSNTSLIIDYGESSTLTIPVSKIAPTFSYYINAGSSETVIYNGNEYLGDENLSITYSGLGTYTSTSASTEPLFQTERYGSPLSYSIPVPNGTYIVSTHHNELYYGNAGGPVQENQRVYSLSIEGVVVKPNIDLYIESGGNPVSFDFENIIVEDGTLNLLLTPTEDNAQISGISILKVNSSAPPVAIATVSPETGITTETELLFTGSNSTDDVGIVSYAWDFGDGGTSAQADASYTYTTPGTYTVSLTVTDEDDNTDITQFDLTVVMGPTPVAIATVSPETGITTETELLF